MIDLSKIKYKCEEHELNVACLGCVKANYNKLDRLIAFVKDLSVMYDEDLIYLSSNEILKEIG